MLQIVQGGKVSWILRVNWQTRNFYSKTFLLSLGYGPGSSLKNSCEFLGEGLWNDAAFPELLIHGSNAPDKINIAIHLFPNDV